MIQILKMNILVPLEYEKDDYAKSREDNVSISKEQADICRKTYEYGSAEWFHYCFANKPIEENFQNANSPLVIDPKYRVGRIEMNSVVRTAVGLHHNENCIYSLSQDSCKFRIGKIRMLFTKSRTAFLHIEIYAEDLKDEDVLRFMNSFSRITSGKPRFEYEKRLSKEKTQTVRLSVKDLVQNVIQLQSYLPVKIYENRIVPYFQICMIGSGMKEEKATFFESVRSLSKRDSSKPIDAGCVYEGKESYISRFAGDRTACIYGDIDICGEANYPFLTDIGNGLIKTGTENYLTAYAFFVSLQLLAANNNINDPDIEYLLNAPSRISDEDNIREFFIKCLWDNGWILKDEIASLKDAAQRSQEKDTAYELERIGAQLEVHDKKLTEASELIKGIDRKIDAVVEFMETDLRKYIEKEKENLKQMEEKSDKETAVSAFTQNVCAHIDSRITESGDEVVKLERKSLELLFGDHWTYLMPASQTSLVSAGVLLKRCSDISIPNFDYSGICICATAALEAELKRVFFDGLLKYMTDKYGDPDKAKGDAIFDTWPEVLLTASKFQYSRNNSRVRKIKDFTMGTLPFLFGKIGKYSDKKGIRSHQLTQSNMMKRRMAEYLAEIINDKYRKDPVAAFYVSNDSGGYAAEKSGCFVWKCEKIRKDYRNKAAHVNVMTEREAAGCYQSIIRRPEMPEIYVYNAEITGVLLELFNIIEGNKLIHLDGCRQAHR